jgi:hypothetical protein
MCKKLHVHTLPPPGSLEPEVSIILELCFLFHHFHDVPQNHYNLDIGQVKVSSTSVFCPSPASRLLFVERYSFSRARGNHRVKSSKPYGSGYRVSNICSRKRKELVSPFCYRGQDLKELVEISRESSTTVVLDEVNLCFAISTVAH